MNDVQNATTTLPVVERPLLRYRNEDADDYFERDVVIFGTIARVDEDTVTIVEGPHLSMEIYLDDLVPLFENDEDFTLAILADAALNHDIVRIELTHDALAYVNPKQEERFAAPDAEPLLAVPEHDDLFREELDSQESTR